jgi:hypothetical protein
MTETDAGLKEKTLEEQITELHEKIDALVEQHVDKIKEGAPTIPKSVLLALAIARGDATGRCKCSIYRHLRKTNAV